MIGPKAGKKLPPLEAKNPERWVSLAGTRIREGFYQRSSSMKIVPPGPNRMRGRMEDSETAPVGNTADNSQIQQ